MPPGRDTRVSIPTPQASDFRTLFPEFTEQDYPDELIQRWIETAGYIHSITQRGWLFLTAHLLSIARADGALDGVATPDQGKGLIRVRELGKKKAEFIYGENAMAFYQRTSYGRMYCEISKRASATGIGVRVY